MNSDQVKQMRQQSGLSISQAARLVCVSDRTWQRYEQGTRQMPEPVLELFCLKTKTERP
jgi:DNA-binding transcriptional regulator YiaG